MTGAQWLLLIGTAVAFLFTGLLLIDAVARRTPQEQDAGGSVPSVFVEWCPARPQPKAAAEQFQHQTKGAAEQFQPHTEGCG